MKRLAVSFIVLLATTAFARPEHVSIDVKMSSGVVTVTTKATKPNTAIDQLAMLVKRCSERAHVRDMRVDGTYEFSVAHGERFSVELAKSSRPKGDLIRECIDERVRARSGKSDADRAKERGSGIRDMSLE